MLREAAQVAHLGIRSNEAAPVTTKTQVGVETQKWSATASSLDFAVNFVLYLFYLVRVRTMVGGVHPEIEMWRHM